MVLSPVRSLRLCSCLDIRLSVFVHADILSNWNLDADLIATGVMSCTVDLGWSGSTTATLNMDLSSGLPKPDPNGPPASHPISSPIEEETDAALLSPTTEAEPQPGLGGNPVRCRLV